MPPSAFAPIRRHCYDSGANEGMGFYAEEMMLQAGLFDHNPHTREIIYNFMRLRALRVEVDVKPALGEIHARASCETFGGKVPMDSNTARQEAIAFSTGPSQAITYQIGKLQTDLRLLYFQTDCLFWRCDRSGFISWTNAGTSPGLPPLRLSQRSRAIAWDAGLLQD